MLKPRYQSIARRRIERGITLPELLVVVAIMGLLMLITIPAIGNYVRAARVRASNDGLVGDLRAARYIAITNRTTSTVTFDQAARTWSYVDIRGATITRTLEGATTFTTLSGTPVTFKSDGSTSTGAASIVIQGTVVPGVTHQFSIAVSSVGRVSSVFTRL